jgi:hypothetical protein
MTPDELKSEGLKKLAEQVATHALNETSKSSKNHLPEFNDPSLGTPLNLNSKQDLINHIIDTANDPTTKGFVTNAEGTHIYMYNQRTNTFLALGPEFSDGGTVFRPSQKESYFLDELSRKSKNAGKILELVPEGGLPAIAAKFESTSGFWPKLGKLLGDTGQIAGKILGPLGLVCVTSEVMGLTKRAEAAANYGLIPEEALLEYDAILAGHIAQDSADPTIVGGELVTQAAFDAWAKKYDLPEFVKKELEPSSIYEMVFGQTAPPPPSRDDVYNALPDSLAACGPLPPEVESLMVYKDHMYRLERELKSPALNNADRMMKESQYNVMSGLFDNQYDELCSYNGMNHVTDYLKANPKPVPAQPDLEQTPTPGAAPTLSAPKL